jgi:multiple sugar transport system permease protein
MFNMSIMLEIETYSVPPHFIPQNPVDFWYRIMFGLPVTHQLAGAVGVMNAALFTHGIYNSIFVALPTSLAVIAVSSLVAYAFGRLNFRHKNALLFSLLTSRTLPPISIVIPYFIFFTVYVPLYGTTYGLMIMYFITIVPMVSWILTGYFASLPIEIERASRIDGCTRTSSFRRVILPMAAPGVAAGFLISFIMCYNEYLFAMILTMGSEGATLPALLAGLFSHGTVMPLMSALVIVAMIPPVVLALIFQRYITQLRIVDPVTTL